MKRKVLGKGIEAIISNRAPENAEKTLANINIEDIYPNPFQPRKVFDSEKIEALARSINEAGMIQPIVVYRKDEKYFLLVGERRWRAAQYLKWETIPALIKDLSIDEIMIGTLVENIQRENLNAIEIAEGVELTLKSLLDAMKKSNIEVVDPQGEPFDPNLHQAMSMVENNDVEPNSVIAVMQKGYTLNGRLVRPAMVMVSKSGG